MYVTPMSLKSLKPVHPYCEPLLKRPIETFTGRIGPSYHHDTICNQIGGLQA